MNIFLNGSPVHCLQNTTVSQLFEQQNINTSHIAVAIDEVVVFRKNWDTITLTEGCNVLIIKATQGG